MRRLLVVVLPLIAWFASLALADEDTAKAAATRKLLKHKVTLEYKDEAISVLVDDIKDQIKGLSLRLDVKSGLNRNTKVTISKKDAPLDEVLNAICDKQGWGYSIISKEKNAYDGQLVLKNNSKERGYEEGTEPAGAKDDKDAKDKGKTKDKKDGKGKGEPAGKAEPKPKEKGADDEERAERAATLKLKTAKELIAEDKKERAKEVLEDLLKKYPRTKAAEEAKKLLDKL
jgi:hypothetical protein